MSSAKKVIVSGSFDDVRSRDLRFLQEAANLGELTVLLWSDEAVKKFTNKAPKFPLAERLYFLNAVRYVTNVIEQGSEISPDTLPENLHADIWADFESPSNQAREKFCNDHG